jgi:hypothetical protein
MQVQRIVAALVEAGVPTRLLYRTADDEDT